MAGYLVAVRLQTLEVIPVRNENVILDGSSANTKDTGRVIFRDVQAGVHSVEVPALVSVNGATYEFSGWADDALAGNARNFNLRITTQLVAYYKKSSAISTTPSRAVTTTSGRGITTPGGGAVNRPEGGAIRRQAGDALARRQAAGPLARLRGGALARRRGDALARVEEEVIPEEPEQPRPPRIPALPPPRGERERQPVIYKHHPVEVKIEEWKKDFEDEEKAYKEKELKEYEEKYREWEANRLAYIQSGGTGTIPYPGPPPEKPDPPEQPEMGPDGFPKKGRARIIVLIPKIGPSPGPWKVEVIIRSNKGELEKDEKREYILGIKEDGTPEDPWDTATDFHKIFKQDLYPGYYTVTVEVYDHLGQLRGTKGPQPLYIIGVGKAAHDYRAGPGGGYQMPTGTPLGTMLSMGGIRQRLGKQVNQLLWSQRKANPAVRNAVNAGKKMLDELAAAEYSRLFEGPGGVKQRAQRRLRELQAAREEYERSMATLRRYFREYKRRAGVPLLVTARMASAQDLTNIANTIAQDQPALRAQMEQHQNIINQYLHLKDGYETEFDKDLMDASKRLADYLKEKARVVSIRLARRYRFPITPLADEKTMQEAAAYAKGAGGKGYEDTIQLYSELNGYAVEIAEEFVRRGRTFLFALSRQIGRFGLASETVAETYYNVIRSLWDLITGPWTIAWVFAVIQFYFSLSYIGYQPTLLFTMPAGGAIMMFLMNFSQIKRPLDGVTHAGVGALLGQGIIIFMFALGITPNLWGWGWFVGIWFIFGTIGAFEFYPVGGPQIMFQTAVLVIIFGYIALGPYKGYWELVKDQLRAPLYTMYVSMKNAVNDVWLLATNPTAWYAKQQVINVRPEQPISFPVEIETPVFEGLPPSAPAGTAFSVSIVTKNSGKLDAKNIVIEHACNEWCENRGATVPDTYPLLHPGESQAFFMQKFAAKRATGREAEFRRARVFFNVSYTYQTNSSLRVQVISDDELKRKFRDREDVFKPELATDKATSVKFSLNVGPQPIVSNSGNTKGQLLVSVSNRRPDGLIILKSEKKSKNGDITERGNVIIIHFPSSIGYGLSCNGQDARTTKAIDGPPEDKDRYRNMAKSDEKNGKELVVYKIPKDIEMKPYEFQTTFALLCEFNLANVDTLRTDYVIAELPEYTFRLQKILDVPVTPPIGILFDPDEDPCSSKCAEGFAKLCVEARCTSTSNPDSSDQYLRRLYNDPKTPRCWYDPTGGNIEGASPSDKIGQIGGSALTFNKCRSCGVFRGDAACEVFYNKQLCDEQGSKQCNLKCKWTPLAELKKKTAQPEQREITQGGKCEKVEEVPPVPTVPTVPTTPSQISGSVQERIIRTAIEMKKPEWDSEIRSEGIADSFEELMLKLAKQESVFGHYCDPNKPNTCTVNNVKLSYDGSSVGLMQINVNGKYGRPEWKNPVYDYGCNGETVYDINCNIRLGIAVLLGKPTSCKTTATSFSCSNQYGSVDEVYTPWKARIRGYNGCACTSDRQIFFVQNVIAQDVSQYAALIEQVRAGEAFS